MMPFDPKNFSEPEQIACNSCKHYRPFSNPPSCTAFPNGIPDSILDGDDHREPVRGDHGIQYESARRE